MNRLYALLCVLVALFVAGAIPATLTDRQIQSFTECGLNEPCQKVALTPVSVATVSEGRVTCSTSSTTLLAANTRRIEAVYVNTSSQAVLICSGTTPCVTASAASYAQNTGFVDDKYTGALYCITAASSADVYVREISR